MGDTDAITTGDSMRAGQYFDRIPAAKLTPSEAFRELKRTLVKYGHINLEEYAVLLERRKVRLILLCRKVKREGGEIYPGTLDELSAVRAAAEIMAVAAQYERSVPE